MGVILLYLYGDGGRELFGVQDSSSLSGWLELEKRILLRSPISKTDRPGGSRLLSAGVKVRMGEEKEGRETEVRLRGKRGKISSGLVADEGDDPMGFDSRDEIAKVLRVVLDWRARKSRAERGKETRVERKVKEFPSLRDEAQDGAKDEDDGDKKSVYGDGDDNEGGGSARSCHRTSEEWMVELAPISVFN